MKASEMITELIKLMRNYGDREVRMSYDGGCLDETCGVEKQEESSEFIIVSE